jgi:acyl carrier protein
LQAAKAQDEVKNILLTTDKLLQDNDFKVSRKKIAKRYAANSFTIVDPNGTEEHAELLLSVLEKEICACFAQALQIDISEVNPSSDFFADLGGSSLDYFALVDLIKDRFGVELAIDEDKKLSSVSDFHQYIKNC